jgi:phosphohistidine phosphatase
MKWVLLLRHAKSSWKNPDLADHDRPLNKRGKHDAPLMGRLLKREDIIISSTATRARATAEAVAKAYKGEIVLNKSLYAAGPEAYLGVIHDLSDEGVRVLIFGHNPGLEELVELLTGEIQLMPTVITAKAK